jgi:signal transduction histidine kinase
MILRYLLRLLRALWLPVLLVVLVVVLVYDPIKAWLVGEEAYDEAAVTEWVQEARVYQTLPELVDELLRKVDEVEKLQRRARDPDPKQRPSDDELHKAQNLPERQRQQIKVHLQSLCDPVTKMYPGRMPLFVIVYQMTLRFDPALEEKIKGDPALKDIFKEITWDSGRPRHVSQVRHLTGARAIKVHSRGVYVDVDYQMRVYAREQYREYVLTRRKLQLGGVGALFALVGGLWVYLDYTEKRERRRGQQRAEQQANEYERLRLAEEVKRQEAEKKQQEAEHTALELKSQLFANIGIMAGSYAHNIKNLLVRPNDLLGRCLEQDGLSAEQGHMLQEVRQTLGTVTERLQRILQTVRRDPSQAVRVALDLNQLVREMRDAWADVAGDKWKLTIDLEMDPAPLPIAGDPSHLQQALENLLFNARDATFEMRTYLREQARKTGEGGVPAGEPQQRRQALIAAASWKGQVWLRTRHEDDRAVLEIEDNGIGMTEEVRRRCTEPHFSTKRDNALFTGFSAGMGLGLSFVLVILQHHQATLTISSEPLRGARFRIAFPLAMASV